MGLCGLCKSVYACSYESAETVRFSQIEKLLLALRIFRINQTVTVDDAIYSCEIVHAYMMRLKTEGVSVGSRKSMIKALIAFSKFIELRLEPGG